MSIGRDIRMPWWALLSFAAGMYVLRSALRGWDFAPDPIDAIVFGGLIVLILARHAIARWMTESDDEES